MRAKKEPLLTDLAALLNQLLVHPSYLTGRATEAEQTILAQTFAASAKVGTSDSVTVASIVTVVDVSASSR